MKLHTLKQSLLASLGISLVSVSMGADQSMLEEGHTPQLTNAVITKGIKASAKSKKAPIKNDKEFVDALNKLVGRIEVFNDKTISTLDMFLTRIREFLDFKGARKVEYFNKGKTAFGSLSGIAEYIDRVFKRLILEKILEVIHVFGQSEKDIIGYYKESGQEAVFIYLQTLTKQMLEKMNSEKIDLFSKIHGVNCLSRNNGILYILQDQKGPVPVFVSKEHSQKEGYSPYVPYYGIYREGYLKRGFVYDKGNLITRPGIFINKNEIYIYSGNIFQDALFLINTSAKIFKEGDKTIIDKIFPGSKPLTGDYEGYFISVTDAEKMALVQKELLDEACNVSVDSNSLKLLISTLSALSEIMTYEEDRKSAEEERKAASAKKQEQDQKKPSFKKAKKSKELSQKISTEPAQAKEETKSTAIQPLDTDLEMKTEESNPAPEIISSEATNMLRTEMLPEIESTEQNEVSFEASDEVEAPQSATETSLIEKEIKKSLSDQVMATVPKGRIKQHVLDRLIGKWLAMTQIPMDTLNTFVRGSHTTVHSEKGVITFAKKHNGKD